MIQLFDPYQERLQGRNLLASDDVTVPAGGRATARLDGRDGGQYGVLALSVDTTEPGQILSLSTLDGDLTLVEGVHAQAISRIFERRAYDLAAPFVVRQGEFLRATFTNPTTTESSNSVLVQGLPKELLRQRRESILQNLEEIPDVQFAYVPATTLGAQESKEILYELPKGSWTTDHISIVAPGSEEGVSVNVEGRDDTLIDTIRVADLQRYSEHRLSLVAPIEIGGSEVLKLRVSNGLDRSVSVSSVIPLYEQVPSLNQIGR